MSKAMTDFSEDDRVVMTLDAGGTNLVFSAMQGDHVLVDEIVLPSFPNNLDRCLGQVIEGFDLVRKQLAVAPAAISFAFPGPADYPRGIIGDLPNLPAFRGGVPLGPMLEDRYGIPVFINNDGDLFAFGEALSGFLPCVNRLLENAGNPKRYHNLLGLTLGSGFGGGIVRNGELFRGDNSIGGEMWLLRDKLAPGSNIEEHVSARGLRREFASHAGIPVVQAPSASEIHEIASGKRPGNREAASYAFGRFAEAMGDAIANAITLVDGLVVIGGGIAAAADLFLPLVLREMNSTFTSEEGGTFRRLAATVYNLEDKEELQRFLAGAVRTIRVPGSGRLVSHDPTMRIGVGISREGAGRSIARGAYAFAVQSLDGMRH